MRINSIGKYLIITVIVIVGLIYVFNFFRGISSLQGQHEMSKFNEEISSSFNDGIQNWNKEKTLAEKYPDIRINRLLIDGKYSESILFIDSIMTNAKTLEDVFPNTQYSMEIYMAISLLKRGDGYMAEKKYEQAIMDYENVCQYSPQYYFKLIDAYELNNQKEKAKKAKQIFKNYSLNKRELN
jgi:tetratricopeptide (TPR) repeat protein